MDETLAATRRDEPVPGLTEPYPVDGDLLVERPDTPADDARQPTTGVSEADGGEPGLLGRFDDHWYEPDSHRYAYAIRTPDGDRVYRKTADGAESALENYYE
mgnify:CR=1 FL=1